MIQPLKISVIIPVYNRADVIGRAVDSALNQTIKPIEIIVVDDGSTDDPEKVLKNYGDKIRFIKQSNTGPSAARNHGISVAEGDYIAFLDSDDAWLPDKIERQVSMIISEEISFIITDSNGFPGSSQKATTFQKSIFADLLKQKYPFVKNCFEMLVEQNFIHLSTVLIEKKWFIEAGGFDEKMDVAEDTDLWLRLSLHHRIGIIPEVLALRDFREDKLSGDKEKEFAGRIRIFEKLLKSPELDDHQKKIVRNRKEWVFGRLLGLYWHHLQMKKISEILFKTKPEWLFSRLFYRGFRGEYLEQKQIQNGSNNP